MGLHINTNVSSLILQNHLKGITAEINTTLERLTTGKKLNSAKDDPSGVGLASKFEAQKRGFMKAQENVQDGLTLLESAEDGLNSILSQLQSFREVALEAASDGILDYTPYENQADSFQDAIDMVANTTSFNGTNLLDGSVVGAFNIHAGASSPAVNRIDISDSIDREVTSAGLGVGSAAITLANQADALTAVDELDTAIQAVADRLTIIGSQQNVLDNHLNYLNVMEENMSAAESRIRDADTAEETARLSQLQILQQAAGSMLVNSNNQANIFFLLYG